MEQAALPKVDDDATTGMDIDAEVARGDARTSFSGTFPCIGKAFVEFILDEKLPPTCELTELCRPVPVLPLPDSAPNEVFTDNELLFELILNFSPPFEGPAERLSEATGGRYFVP